MEVVWFSERYFCDFYHIISNNFLEFSDQVGGNAQDHDSPHYKDGTFHNLLPTQIGTENVSFFSTAFEYLVSSEQTAPTDVLPTHEFEPIHLEEGEISVTWFAHSTILVQTNQTNILMDLFLARITWTHYFLAHLHFLLSTPIA